MGSSVSKKEQKKTGGKPKKRRKKKKYELETAGSQVQGSGREMALVSRVRICTLCVCVCVHVCECVYRPQSLACHHGHIIIDTKIIIIIIIPIIIIIIVIIVIIVIIIIINITAVKGSAVLVASFIALLYKKNTSQRGPAKRKRRGRGGGWLGKEEEEEEEEEKEYAHPPKTHTHTHTQNDTKMSHKKEIRKGSQSATVGRADRRQSSGELVRMRSLRIHVLRLRSTLRSSSLTSGCSRSQAEVRRGSSRADSLTSTTSPFSSPSPPQPQPSSSTSLQLFLLLPAISQWMRT